MLNEYRMTRPDKYATENLGKADLTIRQGYYVLTADEISAHQQMKQMFPNDSHFDLQLWKQNVKVQGRDS